MVLLVIALLTYINLRGVKDAGVIFVIPSYLFIVSMLTVFGFGAWRFFNGSLPQYATDTQGLLPLPKSAGFRDNCSIVVEEHDSHHISLPPINPLAIVQAPAEDEDVSTRSITSSNKQWLSPPC